MSLRDAWERHAEEWIAWARTPGHDHSYWRMNLPAFLELLPPPGRLTLDLGCGEGRLSRTLAELGHRVVGIEPSPTLARAATTHEEATPVVRADASRLPLGDGAADLVVAFMSLHDMDDLDGALTEAARVLTPGGRLCMAVVHPLNSAGGFAATDAQPEYVITGSYLDRHRCDQRVERDGLGMTFSSLHRSLEALLAPLEAAGLLVEAVREPRAPHDWIADAPAAARWARVPLFLHLRASLRDPPPRLGAQV